MVIQYDYNYYYNVVCYLIIIPLFYIHSKIITNFASYTNNRNNLNTEISNFLKT